MEYRFTCIVLCTHNMCWARLVNIHMYLEEENLLLQLVIRPCHANVLLLKTDPQQWLQQDHKYVSRFSASLHNLIGSVPIQHASMTKKINKLAMIDRTHCKAILNWHCRYYRDKMHSTLNNTKRDPYVFLDFWQQGFC